MQLLISLEEKGLFLSGFYVLDPFLRYVMYILLSVLGETGEVGR